MRLAGHTLGTPDLTLREAFELFRSLDFAGVDVIWQDGYRCGIEEGSSSRGLAEIRSMAVDLGLEVACLVPYVSEINSLDAKERNRALERFRRCIDAAAELRCGRVRVYAGTMLPGEEAVWADKHGPLLSSLAIMREWAVEAGITLCIENHFNTMAVSARQTAELLDELARLCGDSTGLGALYDQANLAFTHHEDAPEALRIQAGWLCHVHVKDLIFVAPDQPFSASGVAVVQDGSRAVRSRVPGGGILDWPQIVAGLAALGYDGYLSLEYEYRWHPEDLPPPEIGFREGASYLRRLLSGAAAEAV